MIMQKDVLSFLIRIFSICTIASCILWSVTCQADCLDNEMRSLLEFKSSLQDPMGFMSSWRVSLSCCDWDGISCHKVTGHVVGVDLHQWSLSGVFHPAALFELKALEHLDVSFNNFTALPIPTELGRLRNLRYLNLSTAGFAGPIPWQIGNLSKLTGLDLTSPASVMTIPDLSWLANLTALQNLSLDGVDLSATSSSWGKSVSCLSQLINLTMSNCKLTGSIPSSLQNLRSLQNLLLHLNTFDSDFPRWITNMTNLTGLQISSANLSGSLPIELSHMPLLARIYLGNNKLSANVSQIFQSQWKSLTIFQMPNNSLEGSIPSSIGNLSSLAQLDIKLNKLKGTIPDSLGLLPSLNVLDLGYNQLTGPIPFSLGSLCQLTNISLTHNQLTGEISESHFRCLNNLKYLDLSNNKLAFKIAPNWTAPFDLEQLVLSHCQIKGMFPSFLKTQHSMTTLVLSSNNLTGQIPSWLWNLPKLERLALSHNQLEGPVPPELYNLSTSLKKVELRENRFHGSLPPPPNSVAGFPWVLDLSVNNITGPVPSEICTMLHTSSFLSLADNKLKGLIPPCIYEKAQYLEALDLSSNKLYGQLPSHFTNCSSLKVLNVANNKLEGQIPVELGKLNNLQVLHINNNMFSGQIPSPLRNCKMLEILDLSRNRLSGKVPEWIADLSKLRILSLRSNKLGGAIPIQIRYLQKLQILDLAMNHLWGSIPPYLSNLSALRNQDFKRSPSAKLSYGSYYTEEINLMTKGQELPYKYSLSGFTSLDLSANNLGGRIPDDIGYLKSLHSLNVSHNHVTGSIPREFGEMESLEALDVSCNQLSGGIPETLGSLDSLSYLNLSYNNLSGRIPNPPHFDTFGASSFSGNPELCGRPVPRNCSDHRQEEDSEDSLHWWESWEVGIVLGWIIGFGFMTGLSALCRRLRTRYFKFVDSILNLLFL